MCTQSPHAPAPRLWPDVPMNGCILNLLNQVGHTLTTVSY